MTDSNGRTFRIDPSATVCTGAIIGKPFRPLLSGLADASPNITVIGPDSYVGYYSVVGCGTSIGKGAIIDDFCIVECDVVLADRTLVIYRAHICNGAQIGSGCVIGGFIAERVVVGEGARVFGMVVHSHHNPSLGWDDPEAEEESAIIEPRAFVGFGATVVGPVRVGTGAYVCAGAKVTRNVPPRHIVYDNNKIVPCEEWRGRLRSSPFFRGATSAGADRHN